MYLAPGDIGSVIAWFKRQDNHNKFLCLLVAGHLRDLRFFQDVFEQRIALHNISGHNIAILLFTNDPIGALTLETIGGRGSVVPGQNLGADWIRGLSAFKSIADLPPIGADMREKIITTSQSMAYQICDYFGIRVEDIPCILLLSKGCDEPFVIPTRGEADAQTYYSFLRDLRGVADVLPADFELYEPLRKAKSLVERNQLAQAIDDAEQAEQEFQRAKDACMVALVRLPISSEFIHTLFSDERMIWRMVGLLHMPQPDDPLLSQPGFQQAYQDAEFIKCCQYLGRIYNWRKKAKERLDRQKVRAEQFLAWSEQTRLVSIEEAINALCRGYETRFTWRARLRPLRDVLEKVLVGGKTVNDLISIEQNIRKLIGP